MKSKKADSDSGLANHIARLKAVSPSQNHTRGENSVLASQKVERVASLECQSKASLSRDSFSQDKASVSKNKGRSKDGFSFYCSIDDENDWSLGEDYDDVLKDREENKVPKAVSIQESLSGESKTSKVNQKARKHEIDLALDDPKDFLHLCKREIGKSDSFCIKKECTTWHLGEILPGLKPGDIYVVRSPNEIGFSSPIFLELR